MKSKLGITVVCALLSAPFFASASRADLLGDTIQAQYLFPNSGTVYPGGTFTPDPLTVTSGGTSTVLTGIGPATPTFTFFPDHLSIDFPASEDGVSLAADPFNGPIFTILSGSLFGPLSSVSGIDAARISDTGSTLSINFQGLNVDGTGLANDVIINFSNVPVPGPIAGAGLPGLIFAGAGLLGWWRRKRKVEAAA